ncbi:MAG: TIGR00341 family protein [Alteraurantiacibacter sp.]
MQTPNTAQANAVEPAEESRTGFAQVMHTMSHWWASDVTASVDQVAVIEKRRAECTLSARYLLMTCMSAGIAILGLLQGSAAVVIGAMLLSPLMDPIMGVGFALAIADNKWLRQALRSLLIGTLVAILFTALVVWASPLQTITSEIASRTRPSLLDLGVAIFSSIAGAYAMIRGREGTIVGVAIATALMPPLAVVGFGLATWNGTVFWGALFLFVTNLTAIALTATAMARLYGFSSSLSEKQTQLQAFLIFAAFVALAIPLFLSLRQIVWESQATRQSSNVVAATFDDNATVSQLDMNYDSDPITVTATVLTPDYMSDAEDRVERVLDKRLGRDVTVSLTQVRVDSGAAAQQEAQLTAARAQEAAARKQAQDIAERLALLAGVPAADVTVDRERRRAVVTARPLDGATIAAYRELERRVDASEEGWDIRIAPPLRALPHVTFANEEPDAAGRRALSLAAWASSRTGVPLSITGPAGAVALITGSLGEGVRYKVQDTGSGFGTVELGWSMGESE